MLVAGNRFFLVVTVPVLVEEPLGYNVMVWDGWDEYTCYANKKYMYVERAFDNTSVTRKEEESRNCRLCVTSFMNCSIKIVKLSTDVNMIHLVMKSFASCCVKDVLSYSAISQATMTDPKFNLTQSFTLTEPDTKFDST